MSSVAEAPRTENLVTRVTADDKALFERAAEMEGCSLETFVVEHLREESLRVIDRQPARIRLNEVQSLRFAKALNAPPRKPTPEAPEALEALGEYRGTVIER